MSFILHDHQQDTRDQIGRAYVEGHRAIMCQAPTAFGKTILACSIISGALAKEKKLPDGTTRLQRVCIVVPAISLINQTYEKLAQNGINCVGVIQANNPLTSPAMPVQIASVQTLVARKMLLDDFDLVMIDEAHRWFKLYEKWLPMLKERDVTVIGLTATPWTRGLAKWFDKLIVAATLRDLVAQGFLSSFRVFNSPRGVRPDLSQVKMVAGDYHEGELSTAMQGDLLIADAVATWKDKALGRPTLVFAVDRAHAAKLQREYNAAGIPAGYIDMYTELMEREEIKGQLQRGELQVVCNVDTLTIGVDWPFVSCIQNCRPTKSEMRYVQVMGRGLRLSPETGKTDCLILDHSTTTDRLGFVDDCYDRMTGAGLNDGKKDTSTKTKPKREDLPLECAGCGALRPPKVSKCPECGFQPVKQSDITFAKGELREAVREPPRKRELLTATDRQRAWSGLLQIAEDRGYARGWAYHKYKELNGGVGPSSDIDQQIKMQPTPELRSWVVSRQIAWVKGKKNEERTTRQAAFPPKPMGDLFDR
jgi:superfamily II DNA or RNA helicase